MSHKVKHKYKPSQEVFIVSLKSTPTIIECPSCLGKGVLFRSDMSDIRCPHCKGNKEIELKSGSLKNIVESRIVGGVDIKVYINDFEALRSTVTYKLSNGENWSEGTLYGTREEAQEACDKSNSLGIMGYTTIP